MASKLSFLALLMERRKNTHTHTHTPKDNDLTFVKAAAWAWYEHNSGSKGKTISEFEATITRRAPRPSRYKLEAMRMANEGSKKMSLLDEYEVQSISRQLNLNGLVESCNDNNCVKGGADNSTNRKRVQKKKVRKGFWLRHGAAVCGREEDVDVVDPSALRVARRLPLAKQQL